MNNNKIQSISPKIWGYHGWIFLYSILITFNELEKNRYDTFFNSLRYILPCDICKQHYTEYILKNPIENNKTQQDYLQWIKKLSSLTSNKQYEQHIYQKQSTTSSHKFNYNTLLYVSLIVFGIIYSLMLK